MRQIGKIIFRNIFTLFNLVNFVLALMIIFVGSYKNLLFVLIAIANTLISVINEIRAYRIINRLRLVSEQRPTVLRDGRPSQVPASSIQKGDVVILGLGDQILFDSTILSGSLEVNESFISGEQDDIPKHIGDRLISGSFVVSGTAEVKVNHVGTDNFINQLEREAHSIKTTDAKLFRLMNNIVKYISFSLIPIGILLLWARFRVPGTSSELAVTSTVAALINMIPEGLILLTSSVLALATIRLSRRQVLVQDLYAIETLARVDCIALDKTGTLTTGKMTVKDIIPAQGQPKDALLNALELILGHIPADNATSTALKQSLLKMPKKRVTEHFLDNDLEIIPFSSSRKYSGVRIAGTTYLLGALEFITHNADYLQQESLYKGPYRIISVVKRTDTSEVLLGFVQLEDELRPTAHRIIEYFYQNQIDVKLISGDDLTTVTSIAERTGVKDLRGIDLSTVKTRKFSSLVQHYSIFARVKPTEKKSLIRALKQHGYTVAMTGDGVNDILAMKEADCSIAIGDGADAARRSAKFVLLNSNFQSVPQIIDEGRQSINNLERSTALFLAKTVYASILAILFVFLPLQYPFSPIEMSLLNFTCIGFPAFILALEHNTDRIKNRFTKNIIEYSIPIGLSVSLCVLALSVAAHINDFSHFELTTTSVFVTFAIDLILIYWISRPLNILRATLLFMIIAIMVIVFIIPFIRNFFDFTFLSPGGALITVSVAFLGIIIFVILHRLMQFIARHSLEN